MRQRLRAGKCVFGTHVTSLPNPNVIALAGQMDLDFAFFCQEHLPLNRHETSLLCRYYARECGVSPIVRVPSADDPAAIAMTLDAGAEGIIVPYVETVEEVRQAASAIRHRPIKGRFQRELIEGKRTLPPRTAEYLERFNRHLYLIIGIESVPAIEALESLITAAEVDAVFLGPHDITTSMGIPEEYGHPDFVEAVEGVIRRCRRHNVGVGIHFPLLQLEPGVLDRWLQAGMNFLINGTDVSILRDAMNTQIGRLRQRVEEPVEPLEPVERAVPMPERREKPASCIV